MAEKSLNMKGKMMDPNIIDYYIINCAIPSIITIENRYQIDFGKPGRGYVLYAHAHLDRVRPAFTVEFQTEILKSKLHSTVWY